MLIASILAALTLTATPTTVTDVYSFTMALQVPRTYDNMESLGKRKYQRQLVKGEMHVTYDLSEEERPDITITNLVNYTHKINGKRITYACATGLDMFTRVNLIGNNKTGVFKDGSVNFSLDAEPSYSIGEDDEDNSLIVVLAGRGYSTVKNDVQYLRTMRGYVAGTLGCGCKAYGHTSPTRVAGACGPTDAVDDVAAVFGSWHARWQRRITK